MADNESSNDEEDPIDEYRSSLEDLTFNSKPLINVLTMLAEENISKGEDIVKIIKERIEKVNPLMKMASLYLLDSILKNVGKNYKTFIALHIVDIFKHVFVQGDEKVKVSLFKLRHTWGQFFSAKLLSELDTSIHNLDPNWPVSGQPPPSPTIHVNPKFLKQQKTEGKSSTVSTQEELLQAEEKRIQEQLRKLQEAKQEIEKKRQEEKVRNLEGLRKQQEEREKLLEEQRRKISTMQSEGSKQNSKLENLTVTISNQSSGTDKPKPADPRLAKRGSQPDFSKFTPIDELPAEKDSSYAERETVSPVKNSSVTRDPRQHAKKGQDTESNSKNLAVESQKIFQTVQRSEGFTIPSTVPPCGTNKRRLRTDDIIGGVGKGKPVAHRTRDDESEMDVKEEGNTNLSQDPRRDRLMANKGGSGNKGTSNSGDRKSDTVPKDPRLLRQGKVIQEAQSYRSQDRRHLESRGLGPGDQKFEPKHRDYEVPDVNVGTGGRGPSWSRGGRQWRDGGALERNRKPFDREAAQQDVEKENVARFESFVHREKNVEEPPFKRMRNKDDHFQVRDREGEHRGPQFAMHLDEERPQEEDINRGRYPKRRLSAVERRVSKMRAREERKRMIPKEKELPPELRMDNHQELMHEIEARLKSGELTEHEHNGLVDQLELLYRLQRNRREVSEIEMKAKQLKEHRERAQLQELAKSIERQSGFERAEMEANDEQTRRMHLNYPPDFRPVDDLPMDSRRLREAPPHFENRPRFHPPEHGREEQFIHTPDARQRPALPQDDWIRPWHRADFPGFPPDRRFMDMPPMRHEFPPINRWPEDQPNFPDKPAPDLSADIARWSRVLDEPLPTDFPRRREELVPGKPPSPQTQMEWDRHVPLSDPMSVDRQEMGDGRNRLLPAPGPLPSVHPDSVEGMHSRWREPPEMYNHAVSRSAPDQSNSAGIPSGEYIRDPGQLVRSLLSASQDSGLPSSTMSSLESETPDDVTIETNSVAEVSQKTSSQETLPGSQQIVSSAEGTITTSAAPAFMGVADLFKKLVSSGIISLHKEAETARVETPPPELPTEEEAIPEIRISLDSLRQRHTSIINRLYKGVQCASCGLRFLEDDKDAYAEHLDWHFRQNKRQKDHVKASSRTWYSPVEIWTASDGVIELKEEAVPQSVFEDEAVKFEKDDQEEYTCSVEPVEDDDICDVCCELFEQFWDEDLEEWRYRGAVRVNGRTYHYSCFKDSGAVELEVDGEDEEEEEMVVDSSDQLDTSAQSMTPPPRDEIVASVAVKQEPESSEETEAEDVPLPPCVNVKKESQEDEAAKEDLSLQDTSVQKETSMSAGNEDSENSKTADTDVVLRDKIVNVVKSETIKDENIKKEDITG